MDAPGYRGEVPAVIGERYFHELFFDDARIPASCRLGPEGEGWGVVSYAARVRARRRDALCAAPRSRSMLAREAARERGRLDDPGDPGEARRGAHRGGGVRGCSRTA